MKTLLAMATAAILVAAAPAGAQTVYGGDVAPPQPGTLQGVDDGPDVYWKQNFAIYSTIGAPAGQAADNGAIFNVWATTPQSGTLNAGVATPSDAVNPVPEPATWAMMLVGFGAVGGALRSRRAATLRHA